MNQKNFQNILVRLPGDLCDIVGSLPILNFLRKTYPDAQLSVLIQEKFCPMLKGYDIDHMIIFNKRPRFSPVLKNGEDIITYIQKQDYDLGVILPYSFSSAYMLYQGLVKKRIGFERSFGSFMLSDIVPQGEYATLLKPLGIKVNEWIPRLYAERRKESYLHIGIVVDFSNDRLTMSWYKELVYFINEEIPYTKFSIFIENQSVDLTNCIENKNIRFIYYEKENKDIENTIEVINHLDLLISDDKEFQIIAKALDRPTMGVNKFISKKLTLPEDIFPYIRDGILKPLKDRSSMHSFDDYIPITFGKKISGEEYANRKKMGVIILAGGMGRRLNLDKPKGLLSIGDHCLYDILLQKSRGAKKIGILTSPVTYEETKKYCDGKGIDLFQKKVYPTESGDGISPEGNGALFDAIVYSSYWEEWKKLDMISVIAVDNPLADPLDKDLLSTDNELVVIGIKRDRKEDRLGVLCTRNGDLTVKEYFTLGKEGIEGLGYSGSFVAKPSFFEKVSKKQLPFYRVDKQNQVFYERLLIDGFMYAKDFSIIEKSRNQCFFPIKQKSDLFTYFKTINIAEE